ncbi:MAG: hypothetical protein M0R06_23920 [Sphaerochaeta sp.]|jgi:hypothetical protein|nr:hypothetical protein [Sphaerochaeta sp.]
MAYTYITPYAIKTITADSDLADTAVSIDVAGRAFMIANTGAQALYFKEYSEDETAVTATNGMLVAAGTVCPVVLTAITLSIISNASTTGYAILFLDIG